MTCILQIIYCIFHLMNCILLIASCKLNLTTCMLQFATCTLHLYLAISSCNFILKLAICNMYLTNDTWHNLLIQDRKCVNFYFCPQSFVKTLFASLCRNLDSKPLLLLWYRMSNQKFIETLSKPPWNFPPKSHLVFEVWTQFFAREFHFYRGPTFK